MWLAGAAPIRPLAWERLYAAGAALKRQKKKKKLKKMRWGGVREGEDECPSLSHLPGLVSSQTDVVPGG